METKNKSKFNKTKLLIVRLTEKQFKLINEMAYKHELTKIEFVRTHFISLLNSYENER